MSYIIVPAVLALVAKIAVLVLSRKAKPASKLFLPIVILFAIHNLCEVLILWDFLRGVEGAMMVKTYYVLTVVGWSMIFLYAHNISSIKVKKPEVILIAAPLLLVSMIAFSGLIVSGSTVIEHSLTAVRGDFYWIWQMFCVTAVVATCLILWLGFRNSKDHFVEIQCVYAGFALAPLVLANFLILSLMAFGFNVNAVVIVPIATTLFVAILLASEYQHKLTDIRRYIPWSDERKTVQKIMEVFSDYSRDDIEYRQAVSEIERLLVMQKYDKSEGNASVTAGKMGMPRSSLYSIFNRLEIESRGDKKS